VAVPPVLLGTAYGIWKENQLDKEVWQVIDERVSAPAEAGPWAGRWDACWHTYTHGYPQREQSIRVPVLWGLAFGAIQAASPLALWWLDQATVQALLLALIAAVYIGFAVADGRPKVIAVECTIAGAFVLLAAAGVTGPAWLLVLGYAGHGLKDFWQERSHYVAGTRWWPPFCAAVDWLVAVVLAIEIIAGAGFHR
jgi:hypothetical protein